ITLLSVTGCKNPSEPEKSAFDNYTACIITSRDALGDDVEEVCFRKFATVGAFFNLTGRNAPSEPKVTGLTIINKGENLVMVESIVQWIDHKDGSDRHEILKDCYPIVVMPRKTDETFCEAPESEPVEKFKEAVAHHESGAASWSFHKVLFISLD
ncbi:hypothetical protein N8Z80_02535, partial [Litorivicinus sp.]|nr:hypothetical protein [Litorivicinus sp.]